MTPELADRLGYRVWESSNGAWGRKATCDVWLACPKSWPLAVRPAKQHKSLSDALAFVESEVASKLGVTVKEFRVHLARVA